jgi:hypothetical protein
MINFHGWMCRIALELLKSSIGHPFKSACQIEENLLNFCI